MKIIHIHVYIYTFPCILIFFPIFFFFFYRFPDNFTAYIFANLKNGYTPIQYRTLEVYDPWKCRADVDIMFGEGHQPEIWARQTSSISI